MGTNPRKNVSILIQELTGATRRPLFVEIASLRSREAEEAAGEAPQAPASREARRRERNFSPQTTMDTTSERSFTAASTRRGSTMTPPTLSIDDRCSSSSSPKRRTWTELLSEASSLVTFMTEEEHGKILRIASILFLGFLLPYSTGNDFYLLQNTTRRPFDTESLDEFLLQEISLEERMEKSVTRDLSANQYGEDAGALITDPDVELALADFLESLGRLLQRRPVHRQEVDLIHLLAMAIQPSPDEILEPSAVYASNPAWLRTQALMESAIPHQFQIHYGHRLRLVELVRDCLVLPEQLHETSGDVVAPLLFGALLNLRCSLRSFVAQSNRDAVVIQAASMSVAAQCQSLRLVLKPEWDYFLNLMVDDRTDYQCAGICHCGRNNGNATKDSPDNFFCPHSARGLILGEFILRSCRSKRSVDPLFLLHLSHSLTEAIEWQADCWMVKEEDEKDEDDEFHPPCLLASLLYAANQLFYFQTEPDDEAGEELEDDPFKTLIQSSIQLLRHPDSGIVTESGKLLVHAYSNSKSNPVNDSALLLLKTIKICMKETTGSLISTLVSVVSSQSPSVACALFNFVLETLQETSEESIDADRDALFRMLPAIALNCRHAARKSVDSLATLLNDERLPAQHSQHVVAAILASRMACFFVGKDGETQALLRAFMLRNEGNWSSYQLVRLAIQTGNFAVADVALKSLLGKCQILSEANYLWLSLVKKIASAESSLSSSGALGIPEATVELQSAVSYLESLGLFSASWKESHEFQRWFLLLRLDFLDLVTVLRQLTREMRLTGSLPAKNSRSLLHLRNVVRSFDLLSSRYRALRQRHGLYFQDHQSGASLEILQSLSSFMAAATKVAFVESFTSRTSHKDVRKVSLGFVSKHVSHPLPSLLHRLDELIIQPMNPDCVDPVVRAAAMLELIDGVLRVPVPFPRDFFVPQPTACCELRITAAPVDMYDCYDEGDVTIESSPMLSCTFYASGHIPVPFLDQCRIPTCTLLLWYRLIFAGPSVDDEDNVKDEDAGNPEAPVVNEVKIPDLSRFSPVSATMFPRGNFLFAVECPPLAEEGRYKLEASLGCRDAKGIEWDIPMVPSTHSCYVRISRSR